jgi:hypothetical protein
MQLLRSCLAFYRHRGCIFHAAGCCARPPPARVEGKSETRKETRKGGREGGRGDKSESGERIISPIPEVIVVASRRVASQRADHAITWKCCISGNNRDRERTSLPPGAGISAAAAAPPPLPRRPHAIASAPMRRSRKKAALAHLISDAACK